MLLNGVHLKPLYEIIDAKELQQQEDMDIIEKKSLVLYRKMNFEISFAGTDDFHNE